MLVCLSLSLHVGCHVVAACDGASALRELQKRDGVVFDLLLVDLIMPRMSGFELVHRIRNLRPPQQDAAKPAAGGGARVVRRCRLTFRLTLG